MDDDISIDIAPDKSLVQKFGLVGHRVEQAMAELLDNSIDARIGDAEEGIEVHIDFKEEAATTDHNSYPCQSPAEVQECL